MRAYINKKGYVAAVFKDIRGQYQVFIRRRENGDFKIMNPKSGKHKTRAEAEKAMDKWFKCHTNDKTFRLVEKWTGV